MACVIAIDQGGTKIAGAVVDEQGHLFEEITQSVRGIGRFGASCEVAMSVAEALLKKRPDACAVGISAVGVVNHTSGCATARYLDDASDVTFEFVREVRKRFGLPVVVENDGNWSALAEWKAGSARGHENVVVFSIGTGITSGVIACGQLLHRVNSCLYIPGMVVEADGELDTIARLVSGRRVEKNAKHLAIENRRSAIADLVATGEVHAEKIAELARSGDRLAIGLFEKVGYWLGVVLAGTINIFDPEVISLVGSVAKSHELFMPRAEGVLCEVLGPDYQERTQIVMGTFQTTAPLVGAAMGAFAIPTC